MQSIAGMMYGVSSAESAFVEKPESEEPGVPLAFVVFWRPRPFVPKRIASLVAAIDVMFAEQLTPSWTVEIALSKYFKVEPLAQYTYVRPPVVYDAEHELKK